MARETRESVDVEQFRVDHNAPQLAGERVEERGWGQDGLDADPAGDACLAKSVYDPAVRASRYFVKFSMVGPTAGQMVDPDEEPGLGRRGDWTAGGRFRFRPVTKLAFDLYLKFLGTRNKAHVRQAMREVAS